MRPDSRHELSVLFSPSLCALDFVRLISVPSRIPIPQCDCQLCFCIPHPWASRPTPHPLRQSHENQSRILLPSKKIPFIARMSSAHSFVDFFVNALFCKPFNMHTLFRLTSLPLSDVQRKLHDFVFSIYTYTFIHIHCMLFQSHKNTHTLNVNVKVYAEGAFEVHKPN